MVENKFKSEEMREQYFEAMKDMTSDDVRKNMKNENANFQINWNNERTIWLCIVGGKRTLLKLF